MIRPRRSQILGIVLGGLACFILSGCLHFGHRSNAAEIARGRNLFATHCLGCHGGTIHTSTRRPPPLAGIFRLNYLPSGASATDSQIRATIEDGRAGVMPPFQNALSNREIRDIIAYLRSLASAPAPSSGDPAS